MDSEHSIEWLWLVLLNVMWGFPENVADKRTPTTCVVAYIKRFDKTGFGERFQLLSLAGIETGERGVRAL
jgi:hypothetical protein